MDRLVERCAGLDVHKDSVAATVRVPGGGRERLQETRTFSATTRGLLTRIQGDVLDLKPKAVAMLIGTNVPIAPPSAVVG